MFNKLKIPTIAVVENMSTFICPCCDTSHDIFSRVANSSSPQATLDSYRNVDRLMDQFGITIRSQLPIHPDLAMLRFAGPPRNPLEKSDKIYSSTMKPSINSEFHEVEVFPFVRAFGEEHPIWRTLKILCQDLIRELSAMRFSEDRAPDLRMLEDGLIEMIIKHPLAKDSINTSKLTL